MFCTSRNTNVIGDTQKLKYSLGGTGSAPLSDVVKIQHELERLGKNREAIDARVVPTHRFDSRRSKRTLTSRARAPCSAPFVRPTLDYAASSGHNQSQHRIILQASVEPAHRSALPAAPPRENSRPRRASAHTRASRRARRASELGHPFLEGLAARTLCIRRAPLPQVRACGPTSPTP